MRDDRVAPNEPDNQAINRSTVLLNPRTAVRTICGEPDSDGPELAERLAAADGLADAADEAPEAVAHVSADIVMALTEFPPWADGTPALSLGASDRIARRLCETLRSVADAVPTALDDEVSTLRAGVAGGPQHQRLLVAETLVSLAEAESSSVDGDRMPYETLLEADAVGLRRSGAELVAALADSEPEAASEQFDRLRSLLDGDDSEIRIRAVDAIHEISIRRPDTVVGSAEAISRLLTDRNDDVRGLAIRTLIELTGADADAVWRQVNRIERAMNAENEETRTLTAILLIRMASETPARMADHHGLITDVLDDDSQEVREIGPSILREVVAVVPAALVEALADILSTTMATGADPVVRARILLAGGHVIDQAGRVPGGVTLTPVYEALSADTPRERAGAAAFLEAASQYTEITIPAAVFDEMDRRVDEQSVMDVLGAIKSRAVEEGVEVDTEFQADMSGFRPEYKLLIQLEDFTEVIQRVHGKIQADDPSAIGELGSLVEYLDTETELVQELTLHALYLLANRNPAAVARYLSDIVPLATNDRPAIRNWALMTVNLCFEYRPHRALTEMDHLVRALSIDDHVTGQLLARILLMIRGVQVSAIAPHVDALLDAWSDSRVVLTYVIEGVISSLVSSHPEGLEPHTDELLAYSGRELEIDPDAIQEVDALDDIENKPDDETIRTITPLDFLLEGEQQISARPVRSALKSLVLTRPDIVVDNPETIRSFIDSEVPEKRRYGLRLINLALLSGETGVAKFRDDALERLEREDRDDVHAQAASVLHELAEVLPGEIADIADALYPIIREGRPAGDRELDDTTTWSVYAVSECIEEIPPSNRPSVDLVVPYLETDSRAATAAVGICTELIDAETERLREHRPTIVRWCTENRDAAGQVAAMQVLQRLGSRSTVGSLVEGR
jgi:hypothetical protein